AAQAQMPIQHVQQNRDEFDDDMDEDRDEFESGAAMGESQQHIAGNGSGPQPVIEGTPAEVALNAESGRDNGGNGNGGRHRDRRHNNGNDRGNYERNGNGPRREYGQPRGEQPRP